MYKENHKRLPDTLTPYSDQPVKCFDFGCNVSYFYHDEKSKRINNYCVLKKYNDTFYKLTVCKSVRTRGYEYADDKIKLTKNKIGVKFENSISRAKSTIKEYALCNDFDYFVTLTIDQSKFDRFDLKTYYKKFGKFLNNYNRLHNTKVQYIFIPEKHADGAWHMHGLIKGICDKHLFINENGYLDWQQYRDKFGFISLSKIRSREKTAYYIIKYINKDMFGGFDRLNEKLYYCSKGLKKAEVIKEGIYSPSSINGDLNDLFEYDYENEFVKIKKSTNVEELLNFIVDF